MLNPSGTSYKPVKKQVLETRVRTPINEAQGEEDGRRGQKNPKTEKGKMVKCFIKKYLRKSELRKSCLGCIKWN